MTAGRAILAVCIGNTNVLAAVGDRGFAAANRDPAASREGQAAAESPPLTGSPSSSQLLVSTATAWRWPSRQQAPWEQLPRQPLQWVVASVFRDAQRELQQQVASQRPSDRWRLLNNADFPIQVDVQNRDQVGADRLAAAVGANALRSDGRAAVIVDVGTAVTVDLVDADGVFQGGAILPSPAVGAKALARDTDLLPVIQFDDQTPAPVGKSTEEAIRSGLYWGTRGAIREIIEQYQSLLQTPIEVFVTGGASLGLEQLSTRWDVCRRPQLVLEGVFYSSQAIRHP